MSAPARPYTIALMEGDGIGPEIVAAALPVLEAAAASHASAAGARLVWRRLDAGTRAYARSGTSVPPTRSRSAARRTRC